MDITQERLLQEALRQARAAAEDAAAVKSEFLANMSHELRTPLTSIIGFTGLAVMQKDLPPVAREYIERVQEASRALLCTVNDILDFSKLEAGQVSIAPRPTSVLKLSRSTLELFMPQAGAKDLALVLDAPGLDDLIIAVDPDRFRQILLNLVGNAVKFTQAGSVTLRVRHGVDDQVRVEVIDTGPGMDETQCGRLFQRFSQIDGSLTRSHGGSGLGLAICKGLVEAMEGRIGVDSTPGEGSRFWFRIPAPVTDIPCETAAAPVEMDLSGVRVLVVDDHPANREIAQLFLNGVGAEVVLAADGIEGCEQAAEQPFDVILMDVRMPRLDGPGALRKIRASSGPNDYTPILAFTADADSVTETALLDQGFTGVVSKPITAAALFTAVAGAVADLPLLEPVHDVA